MSFFKLGEVRVAADSDFQYFIELCDDNSGWTKNYSKNDTQVYSKFTEGLDFKMLKIISRVKSVSQNTLYDVLHDPEYRCVWDKSMIKGHDICSINPNNDIGYYSFKSIPPFKNRDFVTQRSWLQTHKEAFIINHSVFHNAFPPKKNFVRALSHLTGYLMRPTGDNSCEFTYVAQCDPRGKLPAWVVNKATNYMAPKIMSRLIKAASKYDSWKRKHNPDHKPWIYPEQIKLAKIDWTDIVEQGDASQVGEIIDESAAVETLDALADFVAGYDDSGRDSPIASDKPSNDAENENGT